MYCGHFGFSEKPFEMTPDPKYLYLSPSHKEVFASLIYGIRDRRGFISIVGEVGTGKTTLLNAALDQLDENTKSAYIFNTSVTFEEMLTMALFELGLKKSDESLSKTQAIDRLNNFAIKQLVAGGNVALIIDEAQNLDTRAIENLRLLSNLETRKHKIIQLVIAGQPELDAILRRHELRQLTQRINLRRNLIPLNEKETNDYIRHRLDVADFKGSDLFDRRAQQLIWEYSHGIPRKINILCDNALLTGYGVTKKRITASLMEEAIKDLSWSPFAPASAYPAQIPSQAIEKRRQVNIRPRPRRWALAVGLAFMAVIIFGVGLILGHSGLDWRENISRLSQRVFQSQKISQGGGAGKTPATTLSDDDIQASMTQKVDATSPPAENVEAKPAPSVDVKTMLVQAEKDKTETVPAVGVTSESIPSEELEDAHVQAEDVETTRVQVAKSEVEPVPAAEISTASTPPEKVEDENVLAQEIGSVRVLTEDDVAAAVPTEKGSSASTATTGQANFSPESVGTNEETKIEQTQSAQEETTQEPGVSQAFELPQPQLSMELSIQPGDTLAAIIRQHYGSYNEKILSAVLSKNPWIQNPDRILPGEILKLPYPLKSPESR